MMQMHIILVENILCRNIIWKLFGRDVVCCGDYSKKGAIKFGPTKTGIVGRNLFRQAT